MLKYLQLEEIERKILEVPDMVDRYEQRNSDFRSRLIAWLVDLENSFQQNRLPVAGAIAAKRAMVLSAGRGVIPEGITIKGRVTNRKLKDAAAIDALRSVVGLATSSIESDRERLCQAREMVNRIVALAVAKRLQGFGPRDHHCSDTDRWHSVWNTPETQGGAIQLQGLVGRTDALILLDQGASGA